MVSIAHPPGKSFYLLLLALQGIAREFYVLERGCPWKLPSANDMLAPFIENQSEYGFVLQNFWNNANRHTVPDPFGLVK